MALQFSDSAEIHFKDLLGRYPNNLAALLPVLHMAQTEFGWISVEVMQFLAEKMEINSAQILSTATFYSMYDKQPRGKCNIEVCTTLSCAIRGGYALIEKLEKELGIKMGETSSDGNFSLKEVECLASCGTAPMAQVCSSDGEITYYENLDGEGALTLMLRQLNEKLESLPDPRTLQD